MRHGSFATTAFLQPNNSSPSSFRKTGKQDFSKSQNKSKSTLVGNNKDLEASLKTRAQVHMKELLYVAVKKHLDNLSLQIGL